MSNYAWRLVRTLVGLDIGPFLGEEMEERKLGHILELDLFLQAFENWRIICLHVCCRKIKVVQGG
jgi:hypothetical protein